MDYSICRCIGLLLLACVTTATAQVSQQGLSNTEYLRKVSEGSVSPAGLIAVPNQATSLQQPLKFAGLSSVARKASPPRVDKIATEISSKLQPIKKVDHIAGCVGCNEIHPVGECPQIITAATGAWTHYTTAYVEGLYLRPRNAEVAYAVPINGPIVAAPANNPIQVGRVGVVDHDYEFDYAVGGSLALSAMSSLDLKYSTIAFSSSDTVSTQAPDVIRSIVSHPSTDSVSSDFLTASANMEIDYDTVDLVYRHLFVGGDNYAINYSLGARYGNLDQRFQANFVNGGTEDVLTDIDFEGVGLRIGFDAERHGCNNRFLVYAKGSANFIAGRARAAYFQGSSFDPEIVNTYWEADRVVPTLDVEVGIGYRSLNDLVRLSAGYRVDSWFNMVTTEDFVWAVQQNHFLGLEDTVSFDGLVTRLELRF